MVLDVDLVIVGNLDLGVHRLLVDTTGGICERSIKGLLVDETGYLNLDRLAARAK